MLVNSPSKTQVFRINGRKICIFVWVYEPGTAPTYPTDLFVSFSEDRLYSLPMEML
jgi:hypothetical protein